MKIAVDHATVYRYAVPVVLEPHVFRLRPRTNSAQRVVAYELQITPTPAGVTECLDQDGNLALNAWFNAPTTELRVRSQFTAEMLRVNPFDYVLIGESLSLPLGYREPLCTALAAYRSDAHVSAAVKQYAHTMGPNGDRDVLWFLTELCARIFRTFRQLIRPTGSAWASDQTLHAGEGSCRDLAVLFCDVCRVKGLAARFVSGYECQSALGGDASMHAWAEVYLPVIGWRGYDPARGLAVSNQHVAVAAGFHPELAAPVAGRYSGTAASEMKTLLTLRVDHA